MEQSVIDSLKELENKLLLRALDVGPMHSSWDVIFDIRALLNGKETFLNKPAEWYLKKYGNHH